MRVGIDIRVLAGGETTGIQIYTGEIVARLIAARRHTIVLVTSARRRAPIPTDWRRHRHVSVAALPFPSKVFDGMATLAQRPLVDRFCGELDVLFQPHFLRAPLRSRCRRVVVVHDLSFVHAPEWFSARSRLWHARMRPRVRLQRADRIIAVSRATADDLVHQYGIDPGTIVTVPSGVDADRFGRRDPRDQRMLQETFPAVGGDPFMLMVAARDPRKNIEGVIAAFESLCRGLVGGVPLRRSYGIESEIRRGDSVILPRLVIAGASGSAAHAIRRRAEESSARDRIVCLGAVPERMKPALFQRASMVLFPSFFEGFGLPVLEAMAAGVPVIASDRGAVPAVAGDAAVLVDPYDASAMTDAFAEVWRDEVLRRRLSARGYDRARRYSWDASAEQTMAVLEDAGAHNGFHAHRH